MEVPFLFFFFVCPVFLFFVLHVVVVVVVVVSSETEEYGERSDRGVRGRREPVCRLKQAKNYRLQVAGTIIGCSLVFNFFFRIYSG